ncbi:hypothetical protein M413DRAFT_30008 [Hebeloma cylindrosporum]|uniref:non-specific serine/threonine protein kinase n=1 Tax=Hebeloma cylindrosporum TaxID=76867 RepID=A0A0C2YBS1_HEBCY|nr:hypothetical protein M413DRAFT_30008 [Hebeloma cylindrosporum h7]
MSAFPEEPLDSPVGYFPVRPGQTLNNGQWTIIRKLGWGPRSSTWLALAKNTEYSYAAIKIFTVAATEDSTGVHEREILEPLKGISSIDIPTFKSHFYEHDTIKGKRHLCLALEVSGSSVEDLRLTNVYDGECLSVHLVKSIIGDVSMSLAGIGANEIIHSAVTPHNLLFRSPRSNYLQKVLKQSKDKRPEIQNIVGSDGITYPSVISQPIVPPGLNWDNTKENSMYPGCDLSNFAYACPTGGPAPLHGVRQNLNFLAPEVLQSKNGPIDTKSDIWMVTSSPTPLDIATAKETLGRLENLLAQSGKITENDVPPIALFLRSCLAIKPKDRPSPEDILHGDWVNTIACTICLESELDSHEQNCSRGRYRF